MIKCLNDILHYTGDYMSKSTSKISNYKYPEQDYNYLGKVAFIPYRNENRNERNFRLFISKISHKEFEGKSGPYANFTRILRFDADEPHVAIMVDENNYLIIGDTREIRRYTIYPGYEYSTFRGLDEIHMPMCESWAEFNREYNSEVLNIVHSYNWDYVGKPVYTEFYQDLFDYDHSHNILPPEHYENPDARVSQDFVNVPFRTMSRGYVVRADENGDKANFIVMLDDLERGSRKYILGTEGYFYIDTDDENVPLERINLWHLNY